MHSNLGMRYWHFYAFHTNPSNSILAAFPRVVVCITWSVVRVTRSVVYRLLCQLCTFSRSVVLISRLVACSIRSVVCIIRSVVCISRSVVRITRSVLRITRSVVHITRSVVCFSRSVVRITRSVLRRTSTTGKREHSSIITSKYWPDGSGPQKSILRLSQGPMEDQTCSAALLGVETCLLDRVCIAGRLLLQRRLFRETTLHCE